MHRDGVNPNDVDVKDVLCDFCGEAAWAAGRPCVEGHRGSLICGDCLAEAWAATQASELQPMEGEACTLCLEDRADPRWTGSRSLANACKRCIKQAAGALHKSRDWDWVKPARP